MNTYPNFARPIGNNKQAAKAAYRLSKLFDWDRIGIISDKSDLYLSLAREQKRLLSEAGRKTFVFTASSTTNSVNQAKNLKEMRLILQILKEKSRVIFAYMYSFDIRNLLVIAYEEDMLEGKALLLI